MFDHLRNFTDDQLRALAKNGGLIGIHFLTMMLCKGRRPTLDDFVQHVDYVAEIIGPQHLAFGILGNDPTYTSIFPNTASDTMVSAAHPEGMEYHDQAALLMEELDKRGYKKEDIAGIMGGNYCRVMRQVLPSRGQDVIW
jgi:membrane dipeptidase